MGKEVGREVRSTEDRILLSTSEGGGAVFDARGERGKEGPKKSGQASGKGLLDGISLSGRNGGEPAGGFKKNPDYEGKPKRDEERRTSSDLLTRTYCPNARLVALNQERERGCRAVDEKQGRRPEAPIDREALEKENPRGHLLDYEEA